MSIIKDKELIVHTVHTIEENYQDFLITRKHPSGKETKLSDVFYEMPYGLVYKDETGMGATHLELITERNSIIVEPIKITASSKAIKHKALYVGSPTINLREKVSNKSIIDYCNNEEIKFKKIVVVADSLPRLVNVLGDKIFEDYFLMIDEIDSFQTDSGFREKMEHCIDIYKRFPKEKRALVTATILNFSDPELNKEYFTIILYDNAHKRNIEVICAKDIKTCTLNEILRLLELNNDEKIMVAYNSVIGCRILADTLTSLEYLSKNEVKIFCSSNSKHEVSDYFAELESDKLPVKLNFFTSAYFSGFDLHDSYHLISVSGNSNIVHSLSDKKLKQIAGRCREKLLSEVIVFDIIPVHLQKNDNDPTLEELLNVAQKELSALKCIEKNYSAHPLLKKNLDSIRNLIIKHTDNEGHQFVRLKTYPVNEYVISYFNIDSYLEKHYARKELYYDMYSLENTLTKAGHNVLPVIYYKTKLDLEEKSIIKSSRLEQVKNAIKNIKENPWNLDEILKSRFTSPIMRTIIKAYQKYCDYIDNDQLLNFLEKTGNKRDSRQLNNFLSAAYFVCLDEGQLYKRQVRYHLPLKKEFSVNKLLELWNQIFEESGFHQIIKSSVKAVRLTKNHFKIKKKRDGIYILTGENPLKLKVINKIYADRNEQARQERINNENI